jgi:glycogen operon protein
MKTQPIRWTAGSPVPLGVSRVDHCINFAIFSSRATSVGLDIFRPGEDTPLVSFALDSVLHKTGHVWHVMVEGIELPFEYGWWMDRAEEERGPLDRFDKSILLIDPYAKAISAKWENGRATRRRSLAVARKFDWKDITFPRVPPSERVIYELHVKGFAGSYLGLIDKIPYLKRLGVTTVELLPVFEFDETSINEGLDPRYAPNLSNYWGYNPINFFSPHAGFASGSAGEQIDEFKTMVRELHRAGIEVFLDVVFNHTAEGGGRVRELTWSFRGIDNSAYYLLDPATGQYLDFSGCGNTLNCNQPAIRELIRDALVYWVAEMHVDGFRFDLASVLTRGLDGSEMQTAPLIDELSRDPVLAETAFVAEAWDAAGLYQVGRFQGGTRWAEWNGAYRDDVRHFVRGDAGMTGRLATRLAGSSDLYQPSGRNPLHSINFVTCHDGFTLHDLLSYNEKHNEMNGEGNRDGANDNVSWNCGVEGPATDANILELRRRQTLNFLTILFVSEGTPMLLAGDEAGRTQRGNNNAYCQDNEISWIDWSLVDRNADLVDFTSKLIAFRREHPDLRREDFFKGTGDVLWHGVRLHQPDFGHDSRALAMQIPGERSLYFAVNSWIEPLTFELPPVDWKRIIDTARPTRESFTKQDSVRGNVVVGAHACVLLETA